MMPPSASLTFYYKKMEVCSVPTFALSIIAMQGELSAKDYDDVNRIENFSDWITEGKTDKNEMEYISLLRRIIPWATLSQYIRLPDYIYSCVRDYWEDKARDLDVSSKFVLRKFPRTVYRYLTYNRERIGQLLGSGQLFIPSPSMFNDPFDCGVNDDIRYTFIEAAVGCFTTIPDSVLMFSHYADQHRGICVGFDTDLLIKSLKYEGNIDAEIRPVWYFPKAPDLSVHTHPALCAACKDDIWRYEDEYRLFVFTDYHLAPSGCFRFDRQAIKEIVLGCRAADIVVADCKTLVADLPRCKMSIARRRGGEFGVVLHEINRL